MIVLGLRAPGEGGAWGEVFVLPLVIAEVPVRAMA